MRHFLGETCVVGEDEDMVERRLRAVTPTAGFYHAARGSAGERVKSRTIFALELNPPRSQPPHLLTTLLIHDGFQGRWCVELARLLTIWPNVITSDVSLAAFGRKEIEIAEVRSCCSPLV